MSEQYVVHVTIQYDSALKENEALTPGKTHMDFGNIRLSERNHLPNATHGMIPLTRNVQNRQTQGDTGAEQRSAAASKGELSSGLFLRKVSLRRMELVWMVALSGEKT